MPTRPRAWSEPCGPSGRPSPTRRSTGALLADPAVDLALIPVETPDGYALHGRLCEANPRHMHHAARYTALGNDLEYCSDDPQTEKGARLRALSLSGARLHVNLHG